MLVDLARVVPTELLAEAVDDVLCRRLLPIEPLRERPFPFRLQQVLEVWTPGALPGSVAEMQLLRAIHDAGFPVPVTEHWIGAAHARVDLAYPLQRIAIEMDSFRWHAGATRFAGDRSRGNRIVAAGWQLLRAVPSHRQPLLRALGGLFRRAA